MARKCGSCNAGKVHMTQTRIPVLGTGLSGLVGSKVVELLSDTYEFSNLDLSVGVDILDEQAVDQALANSPAQVVLHCAAYTNLNEAEKQAGDTSGLVYQVNVVGTQNIARACQKYGKHLIHLSTSYVFDGQQSTAYTEEDQPHPIDWYAQTKLEAEQVVQEILPTATIFRIAFPYRQDTFEKKDIWHGIAEKLQSGHRGPFFADHFFTLTPVEWFAEIVRWAITTTPAGIFHATTDTVYTDLSLAQEVQQSLGLTGELESSSVVAYNQTAQRRYAPSLILDSSKLKHARTA